MNRELAMKGRRCRALRRYMLYPYRSSAIKNQQRWSFGILYPPGYEEVQQRHRARAHALGVSAETEWRHGRSCELRFLHAVDPGQH